MSDFKLGSFEPIEVGIGTTGSDPYREVVWAEGLVCDYYDDFPRLKVKCTFSDYFRPSIDLKECDKEKCMQIHSLDIDIINPLEDNWRVGRSSHELKSIGFMSSINVYDFMVDKVIPEEERDLYKEYSEKGFDDTIIGDDGYPERDKRFNMIDLSELQDPFRTNIAEYKDEVEEIIEHDLDNLIETIQ